MRFKRTGGINVLLPTKKAGHRVTPGLKAPSSQDRVSQSQRIQGARKLMLIRTAIGRYAFKHAKLATKGHWFLDVNW
jgi:hypothetical protein